MHFRLQQRLRDKDSPIRLFKIGPQAVTLAQLIKMEQLG